MSLGFFGQYELLRKVGTGGMGELFLARSEGLAGFQKLIVIKRLLPHLSQGRAGEHFVNMFLDEARLAARLNHPNVVQIYDLGQIDGLYYLAMEYVDGVDLRRYLRRGQEEAQALPLQHAVKIASFLCEALHYAHELRDESGQALNLVHRDVSPHNVLVSFDGAVKLTDFGIAKARTQVVKTQVGVLKGKLRYMSPEQAQEKTVDRRADLFALGILLYEMSSGKRPFDGVNEFDILERLVEQPQVPLGQIVADFPVPLAEIIDKALQKDPADRYQNALDLQMDLERFLIGQGQLSNATLIGQHLRARFADHVENRGDLVDPHATQSEQMRARAKVAGDLIEQATPSVELQEDNLPTADAQALSPDLGEGNQVFSDVGLKDPGDDGDDGWEETTAQGLVVPAEIVEPLDLTSSPSAEHDIGRTFKKKARYGQKMWVFAGVALVVGILALVGLSKRGSKAIDGLTHGAKQVVQGLDAGRHNPVVELNSGAARAGDHVAVDDEQDLDASIRADATQLDVQQVLSFDARMKDPVPALAGQANDPIPAVNKRPTKLEKNGKKRRRPGFITLQSQPWSEVWLNGKKLGLTPLFKAQLPAGRHTLELRNPERKIKHKLRVLIRSGKTTTRRVKIAP